jgi:hypothetical protein
MRKVLALSMVVCLTSMFAGGSPASGVAHAAAPAQYQAPDQYPQQYPQQGGDYQSYAPDQLDNLLAPIALYPDPLLAQVLIASTFPDQIQDAAGWVRRYGANNSGIDLQSWDVSVKAVAHYPTVLSMMNDQLDWTTALGQAYVNQSADAMASVQHLRSLARAEGNLVSTPQQQVIDDNGYIEIVPAAPQYIFVPTYDPGVIYSRRVYTGSGFGGFFSFGSGFAIGAWLNYDLDWGSRRVVYDGWQGGGWRVRSRPFIQVNNVYVNKTYVNVNVNRTVVNRQVNFGNVNRFNSVHQDVRFDNHARPSGRPGDRPGNGPNRNDGNNRDDRAVQPSQPSRPNGGFDQGRGQDQAAPAAPQQSPRVPPQSDSNRGGFNQNDRRDQAPPAAQQPRQQSDQNPGVNRVQPGPAHGSSAPQVPPGSNPGGFNPSGRGQAPPAARQPSQPSTPDANHSRGLNPGALPGPQQSSPQPGQPPRAKAQPQAAQPAAPAQAQQSQHGNQPQGQGHNDHGNDNHNNKDRRNQ